MKQEARVVLAGAVLGAAAPCAMLLCFGGYAPWLAERFWGLVMAGSVFACVLGGVALALCVSELDDIRWSMDVAYGPLERPGRPERRVRRVSR
jgi:hypothetical protein